MAGKQYSFDFVLNAMLNGGFSATFTKAQQEFVKLGTEIKALQAVQRDISAYQKQSAAAENTAAKLDNLRRQYELINRQISETKGSTTALEREKLKLEQRIANTSAALEKQREKADAAKERLDGLGISTGELAEKDAELTKRIQELTEQQKKAAEGAGEFKTKGMEAIEAVGGALAAAGIAEGVNAIADAYAQCVDTAGDFAQSMSAVQAIAETTSGELAALKAEAKELGATTVFTAQQNANSMEYMAMAGWDAREMLSGMAGVVNLAAAANEDLAQVSDIVTDNLSAFNMKASESAHFADVLAAAAANSNTNIAIMGETFKNSASVAGALRYSIEDVGVMVGLMANRGVKGSRAGTALRNIFNGLLGGVTLTSAAFGELEYSAVKSDGSMRGLMETVGDLRGYFDQMTEAERVNNAMAIAGMRGYNGLLAILNATDEDFQSLYDSINNCSGAAERMAKVKLDNLNGDVTLMNSAMEALSTTIGEEFTPELRYLTQLKTELLNGANDFIKENPALVKGIMAGTGAFMAMGTAVVGVNAAIKLFQKFKLAELFTTAWPLLAVAGGVAALTAAVVALNEATRDGGPAVRELTEAAREMRSVMENASDAYDETATATQAAASVAENYIRKLEAMEAESGEAARSSREYQNTLALLLQVMPELSGSISQTTDEYGRSTYALETDTGALLEHVEALKKEAMAQAFQEKLKELYAAYADVLLEAEENSIKLTEAEGGREAAQKRRIEILEKIKALEAADPNYHGGYFDTDVDALGNMSEEYRRMKEELTACDDEIGAYNRDIDDLNKAIEKDAQAEAAAKAAIEQKEAAVRSLTGATDDYLNGAVNGFMTREKMAQEAIDGTMGKVQALTAAYQEAYREAKESFSGQFGLFDEAKADMDATVEAAQRALDTQLNYWREYEGNIAALKEVSAQDLGVTQENYNALMSYVRSGTPEAAGLAADMVKAVNGGNTQALTDLANTLGEISQSQDQAAKEMGEWTSGLKDETEQLIGEMKEEFGALDLSEEAAANARKTIQSYVDEAAGMLPEVRGVYGEIARAVQNALGAAPYANSAWYANGNRGYADGTQNAPPGWAWVGEEGPELMRMRGGEQVLPSGASRRLAEEYRAYSQYTAAQGVQAQRAPMEVTGAAPAAAGIGKMELHFHIGEGAQPETVEAWRSYADRGELKAVILDVMEEANADVRRRSLT